MNLIALSIPGFFALIAVELLVARWRHKRVYRFNDAVTDISCGIGSQMIGVLLSATLFGAYVWVYQHHLLDLEALLPGPWLWVFGMLAVDFDYYWWHRKSHEVNLLWAAHIVHHQSEDYNLAVALRQAWFTGATSIVFYLPLALLGLPPVVYGVSSAVNTLYQFWIHTELIDRVGPLEAVLNTPSHHRVHHAVNARYLDRNYAGILILWDRLFGSFAREEERPVYGTTTPLGSFNPLWANFEHLRAIARKCAALPRLRDRLGAIFGHPAWHPSRPTAPLSHDALVARLTSKYDPPAALWIKLYVAANFAIAVAITVFLLFFKKQLSADLIGSLVGLVLATTAVWGGLLERRRWAPWLEAARLAAAAVILAVMIERGVLTQLLG